MDPRSLPAILAYREESTNGIKYSKLALMLFFYLLKMCSVVQSGVLSVLERFVYKTVQKIGFVENSVQKVDVECYKKYLKNNH